MRLLGLKAICLHGAEAAELFYNPDLFIRKGAIPPPVQKTLLGENGVQTLDGELHRNRKQMFMSVMSLGSISELLMLLTSGWQAAARQWE